MSRHDLFGLDFQFFWNGGCDVWGGGESRTPPHDLRHPFPNPPTALPLFALFAAPPICASLAFWTLLNVALQPGADRPGQIGADVARSPRRPLGASRAGRTRVLCHLLLIAGVGDLPGFSEASLEGPLPRPARRVHGYDAGPALVAQGRGRPIWAGVCLFLATVKFVTMIPFLVLFLRRPDRWTWAVLIILVVGSCALTGRIIELPARAATLSLRAEELAAPGRVNDYSYDGTRNEGIISFEHLFYRLGMRDREWIRYTQFLALAAVGAWVAYLVILKDLPRPAAASLVSFFSLLFLYPSGIMTMRDSCPCPWPIVAGKVRGDGTGPARWLYTGVRLDGDRDSLRGTPSFSGS